MLHLPTTVFQYFNDLPEANRERLRLRDGISSACTPLYMLRDRLDESIQDLTWLSSVRSLGSPSGPYDQFKALLERVAAELGPRGGETGRLDQLRRNSAWPLKKEEVESVLRPVESLKSLFPLALQNDTL